MSYLSTLIAAYPYVPRRYICICVTGQTKSANAGRGSTLLPPSSTAPAPRSNVHCMIWRSTDICDGCRDTEKAAAVLLICMCLSMIEFRFTAKG